METNPDLLLTHEQAKRNMETSEEYDRGYARGWWHQPEQETGEEYMEGYLHGWNSRVFDAN